MNEPQRVKLVVLGESNTGKTALTIRFAKNEFHDVSEPTIGAGFLVGKLAQTAFEIWDTAGSERYRSLAPMYYRGARCAIVAYDLASSESFEKAEYWIHQVRQDNPLCVVLLVGTKLDKEEERAVTREQAENFAAKEKVGHIETSAKTGQNVHECFAWFEGQLQQQQQQQHAVVTAATQEMIVLPTPPTAAAAVGLPLQDRTSSSCC